MLKGGADHHVAIDALTAFKASIRECVLSPNNQLPLKSVEKVFDFSTISYRLKPQKEMVLTLKSVCLVTRLLEIVEVSLELLRKGQIITKRNLYYKLVHYYSHKYNLVDSDLDLLCSNLSLSR